MKTNKVSFAKNINKLFSCLSLAAVCLMAASPAAYASVAGHVQFVSGDVRIANPAGQARSAQKGDAINEGDTLTSAPKSSAQIKMQDGGFIAIRPDSQMKFDQFVFAGKEDGSEKSFFSVFKGGFRAITGAIGQVNKQNYRITTPTASIGIRGSDHETLVIIPGSPLAQLAPTGSYSKVNVGGTSMTTNEGTLNVGPNQMGFAGSLNQSPQLQPLNTNIFTVAPAPALTPATETEPEGAAQEETPPIRETATVDAGTPALAPASPAPALTPTTPAPATQPTQTTAGGTTVNIISGTATTNTGQIIPITQSLAATQAQSAADAAALAATGAQTAANTAQTDNTQLAALAPVDTAPASTAIATADPLVANAATGYSAIAATTPVATATAATAVTDATTNVAAATTAVTTANALTPVATPPAATAIGTASTLIGTATPVVTAAGTLTPANATLAVANAAAAATTAGTASTKTTTAASQFAANTTFADATAAPALAATQAANTTLQSANTAVQGAVTPVNTNNASLTAAQTAAQNALTAANNNLTAANNSLNTATTQNAALTAAQTAAQNALTAAQANLATANTNLSTATSQNTALTAAQTAAQNALTTAQANLAAANTNLNTATAQNNTIAAAQTSAPVQLTAAQTAAAAAQTAATAAQTAATQAATLQAAGDLVGAQAQMLIAQQQLAIAQTQQTAATSAQTALATSLTSAQTAQTTGLTSVTNAVAAANTAQTAANTASTQSALVQPAATAAGTAIAAVLPAANNAIADAGTASTQAANAQTALTAAGTAATDATTAANSAATGATTAQTQAAAAQTASTNANAALTTSNTSLATINTQAAIIASNAPIAAYNNPAVAANFIAATMFPVAVTGGFNEAFAPTNPLRLNTTYVLDGGGNLVEARNLPFQVQANQNGNVLTPSITAASGANIKWSGGTAADTFKLADNSLYAGRWMGATVTVTDNAVPANIYTYTPAASLWAVILPPPAGYVPSLVGTTTYNRAGNTTPVDANGNLGILNSASLTANFTSQLVDAAVNLTMNTGTMAGTYNVSAINMPIDVNGGFGVPNAAALTTNCTAGTCAAGATGYSADMGGSFAGTSAASAGLSYNVWPTTALSTDAAINSILGLVAFSTDIAPTVNPAGPLAAYVATNTAVAYNGSYGGSFSFIAAPGEVTPLGNPTTFTQNFNGGYRRDILNGATTATPPTTTANGITFGVWENITSVSSSDQMPIMPNQNASMRTLPSYMYGAEGYLDSAVVAGTNTGPLTGVFNYNSVAATSYDSGNWASGTLTRTTMSANFTNQTLSMGLSGTMGTDNWTLDSTNMPITFTSTTTGTGARFSDTAPVITVNTTTCGTNCGGTINGAFLGQNYASALVQYSLWDNNNLNLGGLIGFDNTAPVTPGAPTSPGTWVVANSWTVASPSAITTDPTTGVLTGWSGSGWNSAVAPAASSVAYTPVMAGSGLINWGLWGSGSVNTNNFSYVPGAAQFHWITAPEPTPVYLAQVLTTSNAVYNYVDGDVTSLTGGVHGTINGTTSLTANFTTQTVAANLELTVNGHNWLANTPNALLQYSNGNTLNAFSADSYRSPALPGYLTVTVDGAGANGNLAGQLVGVALDGAILKFNLDGQVTTPTMGYEWVQGVAALGAAVANDPATPYRMLLTSMSEPMALVPTVILGGAYNNATRVLTDVNGLTQFDDNSGGGNETIQRVSGTYADQGSAVIGGETISWGRWGAGTVVDVTDRATNTVQTGITLTGGAHTVVGPIATGPVSLPTSGTYTYNPVGNTLPTDQAGVAGTLNSATLSANFTAQTVDVGVNVTAGGATLDAIATGVAIQNRANFFTDSRMTGAGALSVSCTGSCGTANHGAIGGGFGGPGGVAAAITYGFEKSGANAGTVNGVAVFQQGAALTAQ